MRWNACAVFAVMYIAVRLALFRIIQCTAHECIPIGPTSIYIFPGLSLHSSIVDLPAALQGSSEPPFPTAVQCGAASVD